MKTFVLQHDLVVGTASGNTEGPEISEQFRDVPMDRLRFNGTRLIDIAAINQFFVDSLGIKHIDNADPSWQPLRCAWDAPLVFDDGQWRVKTKADALAAAKRAKADDIGRWMSQKLTEGYTCSNGIKMNADIVDIQRLKSASELAARLGETNMTLVGRENQIHPDVPLSEIDSMLIELGVYYREIYFEKQRLRQQALNAGSPGDLDTIQFP